MYSWAKSLWPLNRSLTGEHNLKTLNFIKEILNDLRILSAKSGKKYMTGEFQVSGKLKMLT